MAKDELIRIEWEGLKEMDQLFADMSENVERIMLEEYTEYGQLVQEGGRALSPLDSGDLEASIIFEPAYRDGDGVSVEGGSNIPYALRRHEEPYRMGEYKKNGIPRFYVNGRGMKTRSKKTWRGYLPGRKFLANAIMATKPDYDAMNRRILDRALRGDGK